MPMRGINMHTPHSGESDMHEGGVSYGDEYNKFSIATSGFRNPLDRSTYHNHGDSEDGLLRAYTPAYIGDWGVHTHGTVGGNWEPISRDYGSGSQTPNELTADDADYSVARGAASGSLSDNLQIVGNRFIGSTYYITRQAWAWKTSEAKSEFDSVYPDGWEVIKLRVDLAGLTTIYDKDTEDSDYLLIVSGMPNYPNTPTEEEDYGLSNYSTIVGSISFSEWQDGDEINSVYIDTELINWEASTKLFAVTYKDWHGTYSPGSSPDYQCFGVSWPLIFVYLVPTGVES